MAKYSLISKNNASKISLFKSKSLSEQNSLHVDIEGFEAQSDDFFECRLSEIPLGGGDTQTEICESFFKHYSKSGRRAMGFFEDISENLFGSGLTPTAMFYKNTEGLMNSIFEMYKLSYAHYALGKSSPMNDSFPSYCCGDSCRNLIVALWEEGIVSAVYAYNIRHDHAYLIVPFVIHTPKMSGVVLVDPTSDQLMYNESEKVRNNIRIMTERKWAYKADWGNGKNLYPEVIKISTPHGLKTMSYWPYVKKALRNPVVVM